MPLRSRVDGAAELAAPDHQRAVEQTALLQVGQQAGGGRVDFGGARRQAVFEVLVMIPAAGPHLHEAHAALDEPAGDQQLPPLRGIAVQRRARSAVPFEIERVGGLDLHPVGHLERLDARLELRVLLQVLAVHRVQLLHQIELAPLLGAAEVFVADVLDHPLDGRRGRVDARRLQVARQERRAPVERAARRRPPPGRSEM